MPYDIHPEPLTAESVLATFAQVDGECTHDEAAEIAERVNANGGDVRRAYESAEHAFQHGAAMSLGVYAAAFEEIADPAKLAARLMFEASCLMTRADKARAEADEFREKAETWASAEYYGFAERAACREQSAVEYLKQAKAKTQRAGQIIANAALERFVAPVGDVEVEQIGELV